jgi:hypothetical protein
MPYIRALVCGCRSDGSVICADHAPLNSDKSGHFPHLAGENFPLFAEKRLDRPINGTILDPAPGRF